MRSHFYVYCLMCKILGNLTGKFINKHLLKMVVCQNIIIIFPCSKRYKQWETMNAHMLQHVCAIIIPQSIYIMPCLCKCCVVKVEQTPPSLHFARFNFPHFHGSEIIARGLCNMRTFLWSIKNLIGSLRNKS